MTHHSNEAAPPQSAPRKNSPAKSALIFLLVIGLGAGVAWAGSDGGASVAGVPVFALVVGWIFLVQFVAFIPAYVKQTEHFYDLVGSFSYITSILAALLLSGHMDATALLLTAAVGIWAARLGSFLFIRVRASGRDDRFDAIKPDFARFLNVWTIQGLWVTFTVSAALAAVTASQRPGLEALTFIGLAIWVLGLAIEIAADSQKSHFRANPANKHEFIRTGLWAWSRHPNYFGEIALWIGIAVAALPALSGWQYVTLISPIFVLILIGRVSGVPLLEAKADRKWGGREDYEQYKASTPVLVPRPPRSRP